MRRSKEIDMWAQSNGPLTSIIDFSKSVILKHCETMKDFYAGLRVSRKITKGLAFAGLDWP